MSHSKKKSFFMSHETKSHGDLLRYPFVRRRPSCVVLQASVNFSHFWLLLWNPRTDWNEILQKSFVGKDEPKLSSPDPRGLRGGAKKGQIDQNFKNLLLKTQIWWDQILFMDGKILRCFTKIVNSMALGSPVSLWGGGKVYYRKMSFLVIIYFDFIGKYLHLFKIRSIR